jgi:hypothetical protein
VTEWPAVVLLAAWCLAWADAPVHAGDVPHRLPVALAVHVHSTISTGSLSLDQLASRVRAADLDGLILTDNYDLHVEYGMWPLRGLLRYGVDYPSVRRIGAAAYLEKIRAARQRHPDLLWIPGLEVMPQYFWTGSLREKNLTLHDTQKNLLLVGLDSPAQMAAVTGSHPSPVGPALLWPALLAAPAVWLWRKERVVEARTKFFHLTTRDRFRAEAASLGLIAVLLLANNLILARQAVDPYGPDPGDVPAQRLINAVHSAGGLSFWSLPEAVDDHRYLMSDLADQNRVLGLIGHALAWYDGAVSVRTDPYPQSLVMTTGYTGFGILYQNRVKAAQPGGLWDQLLLDYLHGDRAEPVWGVGELAYHDEGGNRKRFSDIQTVVLAESRTVASVLSALRAGAFYARQRQPAWGLVLDSFSLRGTGREAISGQTIVSVPGEPVTVSVAVSASDGRSAPVEVKVIRSGQLWQTFTAITPFERHWSENAPIAGGRAYYRVDVGKGDQHLVSNPVFVRAGVQQAG